MPNIKFKPFALDSRPCYKCGREIQQGDFNWSFNTRRAGLFGHANCTLTESAFQAELVNKQEEPKPTVSPITEPEIIAPVTTEKTWNDITDKITLSGKHALTAKIKKLLAKRKYPFLWGAPGAGKTHLVVSIASDMGIDCAVISCSNDMFKSEIVGSVSPVSGNYYSTSFRKVWEKGGVILFDEIALAAGAFVNVLNSGLAQKELRFPDGARIKMHENCFIIFADNSAGYGNDPLFPERQDLGTAFRDRVSYIEFTYDLELERRIIGYKFNGDASRARTFHSTVCGLRSELEDLNVPVFASPRFAYETAELLADGSFTFLECVDMLLMRGLNGDIKKLVAPIVSKFNRQF